MVLSRASSEMKQVTVAPKRRAYFGPLPFSPPMAA